MSISVTERRDSFKPNGDLISRRILAKLAYTTVLLWIASFVASEKRASGAVPLTMSSAIARPTSGPCLNP